MSKKLSTTSTKTVPEESPRQIAVDLLLTLNKTYLKLHSRYEKLFWQSYMGDKTIDEEFIKAQLALQNFKTNETLSQKVQECIATVTGKDLDKLEQWNWFFSKYQTPEAAVVTYQQIAELETNILHKQSHRTEGYVNPDTKQFTKASRSQMQDIMSTHVDEKFRKACFEATEKLATTCLTEYVELVKLRNEYAQELGFEDFYAYKVKNEEDMSKTELFNIFDELYEKTKFAFGTLREMEKKQPGLRKPWNRGFYLAGDFTTEEDAYFPFEKALGRWGTSFMNLGISFRGSKLQLDLLERAGKYENGFCHWPDLIHYKDGVRQPGSANFTCNVAYGQIGSAEDGYRTLFHEGGHAAHLLNSDQTEVCVNNEYPPASTAWDETQSIFLDSMLGSVEWKTRYAETTTGEPYPFELFKKQVEKLHPLKPLAMNSIGMVMQFEKEIYEAKTLTPEKVVKIAKQVYKKFTDTSVDSVRLLSIPHLYSFQSACSYHGYGLAYLAVAQWRDYFYTKYGSIVDNKKVGKELHAIWKYGSAKTFPDCIKLATGKKLSPKAYLKEATVSTATVLKTAKKRISALPKESKQKPVDMDVHIRMVHGKETIATNNKSFEIMCDTYSKWLQKHKVNT